MTSGQSVQNLPIPVLWWDSIYVVAVFAFVLRAFCLGSAQVLAPRVQMLKPDVHQTEIVCHKYKFGAASQWPARNNGSWLPSSLSSSSQGPARLADQGLCNQIIYIDLKIIGLFYIVWPLPFERLILIFDGWIERKCPWKRKAVAVERGHALNVSNKSHLHIFAIKCEKISIHPLWVILFFLDSSSYAGCIACLPLSRGNQTFFVSCSADGRVKSWKQITLCCCGCFQDVIFPCFSFVQLQQ